MICLGFDTSNYTTSAAWFDGASGSNRGRLLDVPPGRLGLRQNEALFQHVKRLPGVFEELFPDGPPPVAAVGASDRPRSAEGSYMPCFLAGSSQGEVLARALGVPFFTFSHQEGHIASAAWSAGRPDLLDVPHLAWHLSGGTTELLYVVPSGPLVRAELIGGTSDLSAGQLVDRTGKRLGLPFPAGRELDRLARLAVKQNHFTVDITDMRFSLSGVENKIQALISGGGAAEEAAYYAVGSVVSAVSRATQQALGKYGALPVLYSGGVASNSLLRERTDGIFAAPAYSADNALGAAILTYRAVEYGK